VAFSCKGRGLCPSCGAKRAAELAAFLMDEVVEDVGHAQWSSPSRRCCGCTSYTTGSCWGSSHRRAAETAKELLAAAAAEEKGLRPGIVSVVQTFGERANFHPHVHAVVTRGGWTGCGEWSPVPYVDEGAAQELFRHKVLGLNPTALLTISGLKAASQPQNTSGAAGKGRPRPHADTRPGIELPISPDGTATSPANPTACVPQAGVILRDAALVPGVTVAS
jgi:hypothetical protein